MTAYQICKQEDEIDEMLYYELKKCILQACNEFYSRDSDLIIRSRDETRYSRNDHLAERCIVFRFGIYLNSYLSSSEYLSEFNFDCEYNRNMYEPKYLPDCANGRYPDFIIHKRKCNESNLLVIECKGWWSNPCDVEKDRNKIKAFISSDTYRYHFGLLLTFGTEKPDYEWQARNERFFEKVTP